jgi:hypothetical protein
VGAASDVCEDVDICAWQRLFGEQVQQPRLDHKALRLRGATDAVERRGVVVRRDGVCAGGGGGEARRAEARAELDDDGAARQQR